MDESERLNARLQAHRMALGLLLAGHKPKRVAEQLIEMADRIEREGLDTGDDAMVIRAHLVREELFALAAPGNGSTGRRRGWLRR